MPWTKKLRGGKVENVTSLLRSSSFFLSLFSCCKTVELFTRLPLQAPSLDTGPRSEPVPAAGERGVEV